MVLVYVYLGSVMSIRKILMRGEGGIEKLLHKGFRINNEGEKTLKSTSA